MEVEKTGERDASFVPRCGGERHVAFLRQNRVLSFANEFTFAYKVPRKAATMLRTSTSLRMVSSNPGVSIKTTRRPSRSKAFPGCTSLVQDSRSSLVARPDPLIRLMNCVKPEA